MKPFIPKDDQALPDSYTFTVYYVTGKTETYDVASYIFHVDKTGENTQRKTGILELWTKDNECRWIVMSNVLHIDMDKNFSKMIEIWNKKRIEANKKPQ